MHRHKWPKGDKDETGVKRFACITPTCRAKMFYDEIDKLYYRDDGLAFDTYALTDGLADDLAINA